MLINGEPGDKVSIRERGLLYGDGVFRTLCFSRGQVQHWPQQYRTLHRDCAALGIVCPAADLLLTELLQLAPSQPDGVAKIIISRGIGERGYAPPAINQPSRILSVSPYPQYPLDYMRQGVKVRLCDLRLSRQPRLAGIKHLNRLENVLAAMEWDDPGIAEGILLDNHGYVIEGTRSNLFAVRDGKMLTPDLTLSGVAGMQRDRVLEWAALHNVPCQIGQFDVATILAADEIFLVNSVINLWPIRELEGRHWSHHPVASRISEWLGCD